LHKVHLRILGALTQAINDFASLTAAKPCT
jgi:hypothetical protein